MKKLVHAHLERVCIENELGADLDEVAGRLFNLIFVYLVKKKVKKEACGRRMSYTSYKTMKPILLYLSLPCSFIVLK